MIDGICFTSWRSNGDWCTPGSSKQNPNKVYALFGSRKMKKLLWLLLMVICLPVNYAYAEPCYECPVPSSAITSTYNFTGHDMDFTLRLRPFGYVMNTVKFRYFPNGTRPGAYVLYSNLRFPDDRGLRNQINNTYRINNPGVKFYWPKYNWEVKDKDWCYPYCE